MEPGKKPMFTEPVAIQGYVNKWYSCIEKTIKQPSFRRS